MDRSQLEKEDGSVNSTTLGFILGELSTDVSHVLQDIGKMRADQQEETKEIKNRLANVEKAYGRIMAFGTLFIPFMLALVNWAVPAFIRVIGGQ